MDRFNPASSPIHFTVVLPSSARPMRDPDRERHHGAPRPALDIVYIEGFVAQTVIGIDANELHERQPVQMDLAIGVPSLRACETDQIGDTIDYAAVRAELHTLLATHKVQLLEALAEQVARLLIDRFGAQWVRVKLCKPAKFDDVAAVGVIIERQRERFA